MKARIRLPSDQAVTKLLFLAIRNVGVRWKRPVDWTATMGQFAILFEEHSPLWAAADSAIAADAVVIVADDVLEKGEAVTITGFGKITTHHLAVRRAGNPRTGEAVSIFVLTAPELEPGTALLAKLGG